jgi:hypothetical protein
MDNIIQKINNIRNLVWSNSLGYKAGSTKDICSKMALSHLSAAESIVRKLRDMDCANAPEEKAVRMPIEMERGK